MVKHIVTFKLRGSKEDRLRIATDFKNALIALPDKINVLKSIEVGINSNPDEDWDIVLIAIVDKMEDVRIYAEHPAHVAAAAIVGPYKESRACVDFEV